MPTTSDLIELTTPLGEELLFHGMMAHEELSRPGEFQLDLLSKKKEVDRDKILGAKVAIKMALQDDKIRYFNGFVTRFSAGAALGRYSRYYATVSPWLWFLTRTADCRIFQDKTVRQIVEEVFADHPDVADFAFELTESYQPWKYCVQYRETDFNFVSRLLEHEGMYYYFRQTDGHHTLVVTDSMDKHDPAPGYGKLQFIAPQGLVKPGTEFISAWDISREVQPGKYAHDDYDFERPSVDLITTKSLPRGYTPSTYEVYDYPGCYLQKSDGERYAHVRIDEYGARFEKAQATANYRGVQVGARFTLEGHEVEKINGDYLVVAATQTLESSQHESGDEAGTGSGFRCSFTALPVSQQFRPPRITPKPFVQGPQTAIVTGPAGDEIYTDKFGRVKVLFHWDRKGKKDENSSCWIRVSHPWAGKGWGAISVPRIGQEVIVDFLEGDPDQPIVTGRVYNEEQMPPFELPANMTQSGIKSRSSKGGGVANFNEIRLEDKMGSEQLFIHAEKNQDIEVEKDETHWVGQDRRKTIDRDETTLVKHDRTETVDNDETILIKHDRRKKVDHNETVAIGVDRDEHVGKDHNERIDGNMDVSVGKNLTETVLINYSETVGAAMELNVGGILSIAVGGAMAETVGLQKTETVARAKSETIGVDRSVEVGRNSTEKIGKDHVCTIKQNLTETIGGQHKETVTKEFMLQAKKVQIIGDDEIQIKTGSAEIVMKKNGDITIKGNKINVKASSDMILKGSTIKEN